MPSARLLLLVPALALAGCDAFGPRECTLDVRPAIEVSIRDAATDEYLAGSASGAVTDGAFRDTLRFSRGHSLPGSDGRTVWTALRAADERPGTYRVEVVVPGYDMWVREGVRVRDGDCHVRTVTLDARLQRAAR